MNSTRKLGAAPHKPIFYKTLSNAQPGMSINKTTCLIHKNESFTNFCIDCLEPLCPNCVKTHVSSHCNKSERPDIEGIETLRRKDIAIVGSFKDDLITQKAKLTSMSDFKKNEMREKLVHKINDAKEKLIKYIDKYFEDLKQESFRELDSFHVSNPNQFNQLNEEIDWNLKYLTKLETNLGNEKYVKSLIKINHSDFKQMEIIHKNLQHEIERMKKDMYHIVIDQSRLEIIKEDIGEYVHLKKSMSESMVGMFGDIRNSMRTSKLTVNKQPLRDSMQNNVMESLVMNKNKRIIMNEFSPIKSTIKRPNKNPNILQDNNAMERSLVIQDNDYSVRKGEQKGNITLDNSNYFNSSCMRKFLFFFEDNSKNFYFMDLDSLEFEKRSEFNCIELDIPFRIPLYHRSIITPSGDIILTGGLNPSNIRESLGNTYKLDYSNKKLIPLQNMCIARNSHSVAFIDKDLYVVCGSTNDDSIYSNSLERFDISSNQWNKLSPCSLAVSNCILIPFNERFLYKFGGKAGFSEEINLIERFDIRNEIWASFSIRKDIPIVSKLWASAGLQINQNEIMIFGGVTSNYSSNEVALCKINNEGDIIVSSCERMCKQGGFTLNPIKVGDKIVILQNICSEKSSSVYFFNKKSLLFFNSKSGEWSDFT